MLGVARATMTVKTVRIRDPPCGSLSGMPALKKWGGAPSRMGRNAPLKGQMQAQEGKAGVISPRPETGTRFRHPRLKI